MTARLLAAFAATELLLGRLPWRHPIATFDAHQVPAGGVPGELRHCSACGYTRYFELLGDGTAECVPYGHRAPA